jgi:integrase/recombinase XerD
MDAVVTIRAFEDYLSSCGYAPRTVASYRENLTPFMDYLKQNRIIDLRKVTASVIEAYRRRVMTTHLAAESKALRLRPVKRLFEHLVATHRLLINPAEGVVETCRKHRRIGPVLNPQEIQALMAQPDLTRRVHLRNRAIMELMYATGMRIGELVHLNVNDADLGDRTVFIAKGKGRKQRVAPMGKNAARWLARYLDEVRPAWLSGEPSRLFLNHHGRGLTGDSVRTFLRRYRLAAGIEKPVSPHTLRRTCATHLLAAGADIRFVQALLGHCRLATTQFYTRVLPVEIKATHDKTHPGIGHAD